MVFRVNYRQQRSERDRAKQAKKEAKLREREEAARRKLETEQTGEAGEQLPRTEGRGGVTARMGVFDPPR